MLVPGGTGTIGSGVVRSYLAAGANVVVPTRTEDRANAFCRELGDLAPDRLHLVVDDYTTFTVGRTATYLARTCPLREGSSAKRGLILDAAQELFLSDGFTRTKMDDIAARSGVTKRTAYDYYGDKQGLFAAVLERVMGRLDTSIHRAIENNLVGVEDLEASLVGFAREIVASALGSSEYATLTRLIAIASADVPTVQMTWDAAEPEELLAARFAELHLRGLLQAPNPRRAADHFVALTLSLSLPRGGLRRGAALDDTQEDEMIRDGVRAFLRAYGSRPLE